MIPILFSVITTDALSSFNSFGVVTAVALVPHGLARVVVRHVIAL